MKQTLAALIAAALVTAAPGVEPCRLLAASLGAIKAPVGPGTPASVGAGAASLSSASGARDLAGAAVESGLHSILPATAGPAPEVRIRGGALGAASAGPISPVRPELRPGRQASAEQAAPGAGADAPRSRALTRAAASRISALSRNPAMRRIRSGRDAFGALTQIFHGGGNPAAGPSPTAVAPGAQSRRLGLGHASPLRRPGRFARSAAGEAPDVEPAVETRKERGDGQAPGAGRPGTLRRAAAAALQPVGQLAKSIYDAALPPLVRALTTGSSKGPEGRALEKLAANLKSLGEKAYKKRAVSRPADDDRPTVAILAPPSVYKLAIAREGGRQSPGDVHLALDPSWLIQESLPDGRTRLLLTKGLYFDADGQAWVAEYKKPRPVRYFANFHTPGANDRDDGVPLERDLDAPMSSSTELESVTNDKLLTRMLMSAKGIAVPATLAFLMAGHPLAGEAADPSRAEPAAEVSVTRLPEDQAAVRRRVEAFLESYDGAEVVVKPSGPRWHSGYGVKFFDRGQVEEIVRHVINLSRDARMTPDGAVLLDERLSPPAISFRTARPDGRAPPSETRQRLQGPAIGLGGELRLDFLTRAEIERDDHPKTRKDWNIRVLAARTPWDGGATTGIFGRAGTWGIPTTAEPQDPEDAAVILKYEDIVRALRQQHGLLRTEEEVRAFTEELEALGPKVLESIWENEARRTPAPGAPSKAQTDYIGLDVMVRYRDGRLTPMVIEVNDHDAGGQMQFDRFYPERAGEHSRAWVATMLARARRDALRGKRIAIVGAGYPGKRFVFERARELGVKIVLIDRPGSWAADLVDEYIAVDTLHPENALAESLEELEKRGLGAALDGITSFWEDDVPLTADLSERLGLPHFPHWSAVVARDKSATRNLMKKAGLPTPRYAYVGSAEDLEKALDKVGFPAVLKPASGAEARFVTEVRSKPEAREAWAALRGRIAELSKTDGAFSQEAGFVLEQFLDGDEVDVDLVMRGGKPVFSSVTDNWPTRRPHFLATGSSLPSHLPEESRRRLAELAVKTARVLGLDDGVFHIEAKMTADGPRIIEVNARMGGAYVADWVRTVWGVDLVEETLMTAARVPGAPYRSPRPLTHLEGEFLIPERSGVLAALEGTDAVESDPGLHALRRYKRPGEVVRVPPDGNDRVGMLSARGKDAKEAAGVLARLKKKLRMLVR
ncbi:MAG: ATP-grasp domain-containing protein [Elusimicrobiota bacterium]